MQLAHTLVRPDILAGGDAPREVLTHAVPHQLLPGTLVAIELQRLVNGAQQRFPGIFLKLKSRAFFCPRVPRVDGVIESASGAHNRHRAIFQTVNLTQAAGLIARRQDEHVSASFDLVSESIVVCDSDRNLIRDATAEPQEHLFVQLVTAAENCKQNIFEGQPVHDLPDQVETLLRRKPGNDPDDREIGVSVPEAKTREQVLLAFPFPAQVVGGVVGRNEAVSLGVPFFVIDAIQNSNYGLGALFKYTIKAKAKLSGLDFLSIFPADRRD